MRVRPKKGKHSFPPARRAAPRRPIKPGAGVQAGAFSWPIRVYYQHTDAGGMVFHANYFSFMECARTELLQSLGFDLGEIARRDRVLFVVHSAQIAYHKPALLNDSLTVTARVTRVGLARIEFEQAVRREEEVLASAALTLACVSANSHRPVPVPEAIRTRLEGLR